MFFSNVFFSLSLLLLQMENLSRLVLTDLWNVSLFSVLITYLRIYVKIHCVEVDWEMNETKDRMTRNVTRHDVT